LAAEAAQSVRWIASDATFKRAWLTERVMTILERRSKTVRGKSAVKLTKNALLTLAKGRADGAPLISQNLFLRFLSRPEFAPTSVLVVAEPHQDGPPEPPRTLRPRLAAMVAAVESDEEEQDEEPRPSIPPTRTTTAATAGGRRAAAGAAARAAADVGRRTETPREPPSKVQRVERASAGAATGAARNGSKAGGPKLALPSTRETDSGGAGGSKSRNNALSGNDVAKAEGGLGAGGPLVVPPPPLECDLLNTLPPPSVLSVLSVAEVAVAAAAVADAGVGDGGNGDGIGDGDRIGRVAITTTPAHTAAVTVTPAADATRTTLSTAPSAAAGAPPAAPGSAAAAFDDDAIIIKKIKCKTCKFKMEIKIKRTGITGKKFRCPNPDCGILLSVPAKLFERP
jgi:hypothetical protein